MRRRRPQRKAVLQHSNDAQATQVMNSDGTLLREKGLWPRVAIVILNYNNPQDTIQCVKSFEILNYPDFEIIVVDNGSTDDSYKQLSCQFAELALMRTDTNLGYAGGNNRGIKYGLVNGADLVLIVNNDTEVLNPDFVRQLALGVLRDPEVGIAGPKVLNPGGYVQKTVLYTPTLMNCIRKSRRWFLQKLPPCDYDIEQEVEAVSGVCWLLRAEVFETVGLLDEDYFMYAEEQDYCYRARKAGWKVKYLPIESILHKRASNKQSIQRRYVYSRKNLVLFMRKHFGLFPALVLAMLIMGSNILQFALWTFMRKESTESVLNNAEPLRTIASELAIALRRSP